MLYLFVILEKPVINERFFHFIDKERSYNSFEISLVFEIDEKIYFMRTEVTIFLILFLFTKRMPFN